MWRSAFALYTLVAAVTFCQVAAAQSKTARPHCRWGGLSDSRGRPVRCLTRAEAQRLAEESTTAEPSEAEEPPKKRLPAVEVRVTFQRGRTGVATKRLSANAVIYARCAADHGGLKRDRAEVRIRFHVAPSGKARDVSVSKRRAVAPATARCIAAAIDGQFVGVPSEQPTVGTAVLRLR